MGIIISLIALGIVIFVHEMGHLIAAKKSGVGVHEFAIGMGPRLFGKQIGETTYSIRALPFGGFVKLAGLDSEPDVEIPESLKFQNKPMPNRMITIAAGSIFNILFGFLLFLGIFSLIGVPQMTNTVNRVMADSPAAKVGIQSGDKIVSINSVKVANPQKDIIGTIQKHKGVAVTLVIKRDDQTVTKIITPQANPQQPNHGMIGVVLGQSNHRYSPLGALEKGIETTWTSMKMSLVGFKQLFTGAAKLKDMAGPIGIIQIASFEFHDNIVGFFYFMATISIGLGVINLLPIPVLDGGHFMFLILESIRGKRLSEKTEGIITNVAVVLLISFMVIIVVNDLMQWPHRLNFLSK